MKTLKTIALAAAALFAGSAAAEEPIITFRTNLYDMNGASNAFHFVIGASEDTYIEVDCGFGTIEEEVQAAVYDATTQGIQGTTISGTVSSAGIVKIYGDPKLIDYLDLEGIYITELNIDKSMPLQILDLTHNELKALDVSELTTLQALYLSDNPFSDSPAIIGPKPELQILALENIGALDPAFTLKDCPKLLSLDAYHCPSLTVCEPAYAPGLLRLSLDITNVETLDVSKNPELIILNIAQTKITEIDLSKCKKLAEFYCSHGGSYNDSYKLDKLDVSNNTELIRLFCDHNRLTELDLSKNTKLQALSCASNYLTEISISQCPDLINVDLANNYLNFATLPANNLQYVEYYYTQRPFPVDRSYAVGTTLDFAEKVIRPDSETYATIFAPDNDNPGYVKEIGDEYFKFSEGKVELLKSYPDSVYIAFGNTALPDYNLKTGKFKIKDLADFGKDNPTVTFRVRPATTDIALKIGVDGASEAAPKKFTVDFGDGKPVEFAAQSPEMPLTANATGKKKGSGNITVYLPEGSDITAFGADNMALSVINLDSAPTLRQLAITDCALPKIGLKWNRCLVELDLSGNRLDSLDLSGADGDNGKNVLTEIKAARNNLVYFRLSDGRTPLNIDVADNLLEEFDLDKASRLLTLNLAGNRLKALDLEDCEELHTLNIADNYLTELPIPQYTPLKHVDISGNCFTLPKLPAVGTFDTYTYAPQRPMEIPVKAPTVNLSSQWLVSNGASTVYTWRTVEGDRVLTDKEITGTEGHFRFLDETIGKVYCTWTNAAFPDFTGDKVYRSTVVETAGMPTNVVATFTTAAPGNAELVLTAKADNTVYYIDWSGRNDLEEAIIGTTYTRLPHSIDAGAVVKVYSYEANDNLTVFSISGVALSSIDASKMKSLTAFTCSGSQLEADAIALPILSDLTELNLTGNKLSNSDFSAFKNLKMLHLSENSYETFDASVYTNLEILYINENNLSSVKFNNPRLWEVALASNSLETLSLEGVPAMEQLWLHDNKLANIDLSPCTKLRALTLNNNRFLLTTLPPVQSQYILYNYGNQEPVTVEAKDGKVDLSDQAIVGTSPTTFRWFIDSPYIDENGELAGEELFEGDEFTIENGVTAFLYDFDGVMCVMTNEAFPNLYQLTNFLNVTAAGVGQISVDRKATIKATTDGIVFSAAAATICRVYTAAGALAGSVVTDAYGHASISLPAGIYIATAADTSAKISVK